MNKDVYNKYITTYKNHHACLHAGLLFQKQFIGFMEVKLPY